MFVMPVGIYRPKSLVATAGRGGTAPLCCKGYAHLQQRFSYGDRNFQARERQLGLVATGGDGANALPEPMLIPLGARHEFAPLDQQQRMSDFYTPAAGSYPRACSRSALATGERSFSKGQTSVPRVRSRWTCRPSSGRSSAPVVT